MFAWKILDNLPSFQCQIVKKESFWEGHSLLHLSVFADEYGQNEEKRGQILRISYEFQNHYTLQPGEGLINHGSIQFCSSSVVVFALGLQTMNN